MGPVDHAAGDELRIGHQDFDVVIGGNAGGADIDIADLAGDAGFELDEIADFQRTVEQQNQAGDEIAEYSLQDKTQTDTEDRKSNVEGKSVAVGVDLGGRRELKKNKNKTKKRKQQ